MIYNLPRYKRLEPREECLTFSSPEPFSITVPWRYIDGIIEYSTDKVHWIDVKTSTATASFDGERYVLYLSGTGNTRISEEDAGKWSTECKQIYCSGNIETLLDWQTVKQGRHPKMDAGCFNYMFAYWPLLTAPSLPAVNLTANCYSWMFAYCGLTTAPELPATVLADSCYLGMFFYCPSLTATQELPATTLADSCYLGMFSYCTSLTTAPELPATVLADSCYLGMFSYCSSLRSAPQLPSYSLKRRCYMSMFEGCTSLTTPPNLPAPYIDLDWDDCYENMFKGCVSLVTAPNLPARTLAGDCYRGMFEGCTNLTAAPKLPAAGILQGNCYRNMFKGCTNLSSIPAISATEVITGSCCEMFNGCTKIKLSATQTGSYTNAYRIDASDLDHIYQNALTDMFAGTGGTFTGTPAINTTYYLDESIEIVGGFNTVTADTITKYFTVSNGSYYFAGSGTTFTSNNGGVNNSTATTTLTALQNMSISFDYSYSSEKNYDKFTLIVAGTTVANGLSGATTRKSYKGTLQKGQQIVFKYAKDSSSHKNDDRCTFSNLQVKLQ